MLIAIPILIAALGEAISERAGVLNIGLEGVMEWGALVGFIAVTSFQSLVVGFTAALIIGVILGLVVAILTVSLHANQFYTGIVLWIFSLGVTGFIHRMGFWHASTLATSPLDVVIPPFDRIPILGPVLFRTNAMTYVALGLTLIVWVLFEKTRAGLWIKAAGHRPEALDTVGVSVVRVRYLCVVMCSVLAAIAGAHISLVATGLYYSAGFFEGIVAGRGWIAIILVNFGSWQPLRILFGAILIGASWALQIRLQTLLPGYPVHVFLMLPYVVALMFLFLGRVSFPEALGRAYVRQR